MTRADAVLTLRTATGDDAAQLAILNQHLIEDQGHSNPMTLDELAERMRRWLAGEYRVALAEVDGTPIGYVVWRDQDSAVHIRQFFIARGWRRQGWGRRAFDQMIDQLWNFRPLQLEVLIMNSRGLAFWRSLGFRDYSITMRRP